jgi:hypothetical protein
MNTSELSPKNFRRICAINWLFTGPVCLVFGMPYFIVAQQIIKNPYLWLPGALLFSMPFMITVLHGHVTMALGKAHRHHYYEWLMAHPYSYGLGFHPFLISTRFRVAMLVMSGLVAIV